MVSKVPINLIKLLSTWYSNSTSIVNWFGAISVSYKLRAGVRQGGVLSPVLFAKYVDIVITKIEDSIMGCQIGSLSMGILMYADDLVLISASVSKLQNMVDLCVSVLHGLDLNVNSKKSTCMRIGGAFKHICIEIKVNGSLIPWARSFTYLGIALKSATRFSVEMKPARAKFYRSFNSLYCKIYKANENLISSLVHTFCVPIIMFGLEAFVLNTSSLHGLDALFYNVFAKIFKCHDRNILSWCMYYMDILPLRYVYFKNKINFLSKMLKTGNDIVVSLFELFGHDELVKLCANFGNKHPTKLNLLEHFASTLT